VSDEIDFSPLDPKRDARRWEALVQRTLAHVPPSPNTSVLLLIAKMKWGVVAFTACAALAWLPHFLTDAKPASTSPAVLLLEGSDVVSVLELADDR
jgi:hypothetical protein